MARVSFKSIQARAAKRKGGPKALASLMPRKPNNKALAKIGDDRVLADMAERVRNELAHGRQIIIFPEGTRVAPGKMGKFKLGGARLATRTGTPVIPVAHNAGELWPRNAFIKKSGTITVHFGPAIDPAGLTDSELNERVETWIREAMRELPPVRH